MKKTLLFAFALTLAGGQYAAAKYITAGDKSAYTFADLAKIEGSGVTFDGVYHVSDDIEIEATDTLHLDPGCMVKVASRINITVRGVADFAPAVPSVITAEDPENAPRGVKLQDEAKGVFKGVTFEYASIYQVSDNPVTVENCLFQHVTKAQNSTGCVAFAGASKGNVVRNCTFLSNNIPASGCGATNPVGLVFENNFIYDNNIDNGNRPMLNMTSPADNGPMIIRNNTIIGTGRTKTGGISVSNMLGLAMGDVTIENNAVYNCRYGINVQGGMNAVIKGNVLVDNRYETNPMNGGSGISCYDTTGKLTAVISGNYIKGSLWGITLIGPVTEKYKGFKDISLGQENNPASPGMNIFVENGNNGTAYDSATPYDLYNNSPFTIYAQGNTWSVAEQTQEQIAKVIFDKSDNPDLGEVIYMPAKVGIDAVMAPGAISYDRATASIVAPEGMTSVKVYDTAGKLRLSAGGSLTSVSIASLERGIYVAVANTPEGGVSTLKIVH